MPISFSFSFFIFNKTTKIFLYCQAARRYTTKKKGIPLYFRQVHGNFSNILHQNMLDILLCRDSSTTSLYYKSSTFKVPEKRNQGKLKSSTSVHHSTRYHDSHPSTHIQQYRNYKNIMMVTISDK